MKISTPVITTEKKEHMKKLVEQFFACPENFQYKHSIFYGKIAATVVAAIHGAFDFSLVLEHFDEMVSAIEYYEGEKSHALDWRDVLIFSTAYLFFDCPLLKDCPKENIDDRIQGLYFLDFGTVGNPAAVNSTKPRKSAKGKYLPQARLTSELEKAVAENDAESLLRQIDAMPQRADAAANTAYALLEAENWELFAALYHHIDLLPLLDMEMVFEFWCRKIVHEAWHGAKSARTAFLKQWQDLSQYPLTKLLLDWDRTGRIVPVLFETGFLTSEIMAVLLQQEHSFDKPLAPYSGWEKLTFRACAEAYGRLAQYMPKCPHWRVDCCDESILVNLPAAAQFNAYLQAHPQYGKSAEKVVQPVKSTKNKGLTEDQKLRIAKDEHDGIEFGNNFRMLKKYGWKCELETYDVPEMVTAIGVEAFVDCSDKLKHVILPEGVTRIGRNAFSWTDISRIDLPASLTSIGEGAFCSCNKLKSVRIPDGITELPFDAFGYCENLQTAELPEGIKLHQDAFRECPKVKILYRPIPKK